jgi:hypothetical protein
MPLPLLLFLLASAWLSFAVYKTSGRLLLAFWVAILLGLALFHARFGLYL